MNKQDLQSLLMHQEAIRMVCADPSLEARALEILERWDTGASIRSKPLLDEWKRIIAERDWKLALKESGRGQQLRQASPMASLLPEQVRLDIIQSARTMHASKGPRSPWKTHYFVDTEFTDFIDCQLISVAIVGEDGREFYGERTDFELSACSEFVRAAVLPQLGQFPGRSMPAAQLRDELVAWLLAVPAKPKPVLCFDYQGDFDLVLDLLDAEIPAGWKCQHVGGRLDMERLETYFREHGGRHHALHDARANAFAFM
ncbi:3'-5' exoribonuclease [Ralstonia solanacearum]|uniref:3'-5' exoribonuclease n=1 Tax=Ralstonia solanacearum TaxID=305 RepID=UPI001FF968D3|nr:3'-5' exoribonuclease [Ralstonia solanacearum]